MWKGLTFEGQNYSVDGIVGVTIYSKSGMVLWVKILNSTIAQTGICGGKMLLKDPGKQTLDSG